MSTLAEALETTSRCAARSARELRGPRCHLRRFVEFLDREGATRRHHRARAALGDGAAPVPHPPPGRSAWATCAASPPG